MEKWLFITAVAFATLCAPVVFSKGGPGPGGAAGNTNPSLAAGCAAPHASADLSLNNVRTIIHTGGDLWLNRNANTAGYEVPNGSGKYAIYAGALWMGGVDVNGQLKLAAQTFRERGNDFWPGPLNKQTVEVDAATCAEYDKIFSVSRAEVEQFGAWFLATQADPVQAAIDFPGYTIPLSILNWPAHGDLSKNEDFYLAPFNDADGDGVYNPYMGDTPGYELNQGGSSCNTTREVKLYGDHTLWWVFNDKGNIHTQSGGAAIGMEIRAQAFAFATNDEVNSMTFYNYELVNRSTFTLTNTYFGIWVDADLGRYDDDYVGCDVQRGLGYCYNGREIDGTGGPGEYGANPPAIGVDFFEGPYQDNDGIDNPLVMDYNLALSGKGIPYPGLGIGYGDGIVDNERFGMARFLYYNSGNHNMGDPVTANDYYGYLRGIWREGTSMVYGGNGHISGGGGTVPAKFMFPGNSDPVGWGTGGTNQPYWSEESVGNLPFDRRFAQSAGPFTLEPGAVNNITLGVVWAQANSGGPLASVEKMKTADDKAQALFDNCFRVLNGPDAPEMSIRELDRELILTLSNRSGSNNADESYEEIDFKIPPYEVLVTSEIVIDPTTGNPVVEIRRDTTYFDNKYRFQGYLIYQVTSLSISPDELGNPDKARLVAQCDLRDSVTRLINYRYSEELNDNIPEDLVIYGENKGILHSFRVTEDRFAQGDKRLVNHKPYYFMALAYGHNNYKTYNAMDPTALNGQTRPYVLSRKAFGGSIRAKKAVPHNQAPLNHGTLVNSSYGDMPPITRIEGQGNGGLVTDLDETTESLILSNGKADFISYPKNKGPVKVKVIDPVMVPYADFSLKLLPQSDSLNNALWVLENTSTLEINQKQYLPGQFVVKSEKSIKVGNEQLVPEIGISVHIEQVPNPGHKLDMMNGFLEGTLEFQDPIKPWLSGMADKDGPGPLNWIRSGRATDINNPELNDFGSASFLDPQESFEKILGGTWAPYALTSYAPLNPAINSISVSLASLSDLKSVDIIFTSDKEKWTRCPVIEAQDDSLLAEGRARKGYLRNAPSVDKNGKADGTGTGMGWFPGYAYCIETGERLNIAFAEDSWLTGENGRDMIWNPTSTLVSGPAPSDVKMGGRHFLYVFRSSGNGANELPGYDEGKTIHSLLSTGSLANLRRVWRNCMWVSVPMLAPERSLLETEARVRLRVARKYEKYETSSLLNNKNPYYSFSMKEMAAEKGSKLAADSALALINVVPNPYYAYSAYEVNQLDNRVKIINLPEECFISIYTVNGTLIRQYKKASPLTSLEWDLKNSVGIPISGGVYLLHVQVPGVGERTLKWFGIMRPIDLESF